MRTYKPPLATIVSAMKMIEPTSRIAVCRDPDDDIFINCAVDADCLYIVSGDKDLLSLAQPEIVEAVTGKGNLDLHIVD